MIKSTNFLKYIQWIIGSIVVPLIVAIIASGYFQSRSREIIYRETPIIEKFNTIEYFPLKEGNFWIYKGKEKCQLTNNNTNESTYNIKIQVKKVIVKPNYTLAIMESEIKELQGTCKCEAKNLFTPSKFGYLVISNKVYLVPNEYLNLSINENNINDYLLNILLEFEFPFYDGQQFGDLIHLLRDDYRYRKFIVKENEYFLRKENNIETVPIYKIFNSSLGSDEIIRFIPYKGIISMSYKHHGTIDEFDEELIESNIE